MSADAFYLPTNVLVGTLCEPKAMANFTNMTNRSHHTGMVGMVGHADVLGSGGSVGGSEDSSMGGSIGSSIGSSLAFPDQSESNGTMWFAVAVYFGMCCFLTVLGSAAFVVGVNSSAVSRRLAKRDNSLRCKLETVYEGKGVEDNHFAGGAESTLLINGVPESYETRPSNSPVSVSRMVNERLQLDSAFEQSLSMMSTAKIIWQSLAAQFMVTAGGQMVISQYVNIPNRYYGSQTTALVYQYVNKIDSLMSALRRQIYATVAISVQAASLACRFFRMVAASGLVANAAWLVATAACVVATAACVVANAASVVANAAWLVTDAAWLVAQPNRYFLASAAGMFLGLFKWSHFESKGMLIASAARLAVYPLILVYILHPDALASKIGNQGADILVSAVNIVFCFTNGHLFSNTCVNSLLANLRRNAFALHAAADGSPRA
jgi:hypothetical protein